MKRVFEHDVVTRVFSHSAFVESAHLILCHRLRDPERGLSLLFVDIEDMSGINHRHGHVAGDRVLSALCALLCKSARHSDVICRFGGDQISIVCSTT